MNQIIPAKWHIDEIETLCENRVIRDTVATRLLALGLPNAKMEHYRYFGITPILSKSYRHVKQSVHKVATSEDIEICDGEIVGAPKGVTVTTETVKSIDEHHYDPVYYLSHALTPGVITLTLSGKQHLRLHHRFTQEEALIAYRLKIEVESGAEVILEEIFDEHTPTQSLALFGNDVIVHEGGSMTWIRDQESGEDETAMIASHSVQIAPHAALKLGTFDFGSSRILHIYKIDLAQNARIDASHLLYGDGAGQRGNIIQINHQGEHAHTTQNAKHILKEKARGIFDALIRVDHAGKYAVTHQNARSVLLDDGAYMISKPQLEIYIDELEASHGSTTGQLDPAQIFYLQSRGIKKSEARKILIYAFAKDVIETLGIASIQERLIEKFDKRYTGGAA